jgi:Ca2+-binding RTX toxin-like protein
VLTLALGRGVTVMAGAALLGLGTVGAVLLLLAFGAPPPGLEQRAARSASQTGTLSPGFIENRGQTDGRAAYHLPGSDADVFFRRDGLTFALTDERRAGRRFGLELDFVGARPDARPIGSAPSPTSVSYLKGARSQWRTGIPSFGAITYADLWPGIDLVYTTAGNRLKYTFRVQPGADPAAIRLAWRNAAGVSVTRRGELRVSTPARVLTDKAPYSYQPFAGRRRTVASSYALGTGGSYGFDVGAYDHSRPLVIDPAMLVYAGFIGGTGDEAANNVALDGAGNLYVTGPTTSPDFPATGIDTTANGGSDDAYVAKVKADGSGLAYAAYIGGSDYEQAINIAVDAAGAAYVCGSTGSSEGEGFPVTTGPDVTYNGGPQDAWIAKLDPTGTSLVYAGYVGGRGTGLGDNGLDVDAAGNAYLAGFTKSDATAGPNGGFPDGNGFSGLPGFDQTYNSSLPPLPDAWSAKVNAAGTGLMYATYLGGGNADAGTGLVVDETGVYMNVFTSSNEQPYDFDANPLGGFPRGEPLAARPGFDQTFNGPASGPGVPVDAAAVKLNPTGTDLIYWTYIGGAGSEQPFGNFVDAQGNVFMTGRTSSSEATFPDGDGFGAIPGFDRTYNGATAGSEPGGDAFVIKLNAAGTGLVYATYIGGSGDELPVAIDATGGSAHIAGTTDSDEATFPVLDGPDLTYNGGPSDAFVARLTPAGDALTYAGYIGGALAENGLAVAVDGAGNAYTAGNTDSGQCRGFPVTVGPDLTFDGPFATTNTYVAKIDPTGATAGPRPDPVPGCAPPAPPPPPLPALPSFPGCAASTANVIDGTPAADAIVGTAAADKIFAAAGADTVDGRGADDCIDLGAGRDRGQGGPGNDLVVGGSANDSLSGSSGADRLDGSSGNDRLHGDAGNDRLAGGSGADTLYGGTGSDVVRGGTGADRLFGGSGSDTIVAQSGDDRVSGGGGRDAVSGGAGRDRISGGSGNDRLTGGAGRDTLSGGAGDDRIDARDRRRGDRVVCGAGRDVVIADRGDRVARDCERVSRR